jgi:hypothetical protein
MESSTTQSTCIMINWPDLKLPPINLHVLVPALEWYSLNSNTDNRNETFSEDNIDTKFRSSNTA